MDPATLRLLELARPRHADPLRLTGHGYKAYSQNDEDGIIAEIFRRIGVKDRTFVEIGVETGVECNSLWLLIQGWTGVWLEADLDACRAIAASHAHWLAEGKLAVGAAMVDAENVNALLAAHCPAPEIDLLSIDIDFNDYWVWRAIDGLRPRVVIMEYNATWAPPVAITVPYTPGARWNGTNYFGASLSALTKLADAKGYDLVGCCLAGVNAFFVRRDLTGELFLKPGSAQEHYEPPRYALSGLPSGHPPGIGPLVSV